MIAKRKGYHLWYGIYYEYYGLEGGWYGQYDYGLIKLVAIITGIYYDCPWE